MTGALTHGRFLAEAATQAVLTGAWTACGELPTAKRRVARTGVIGATVLVAAIASQRAQRTDEPRSPQHQEPTETVEPVEPAAPTLSQIAVAVAGVGVSAALLVGGRRLEKRWLANLIRNGNAHPHRALGARIAALTFGASAVIHLLETNGADKH